MMNPAFFVNFDRSNVLQARLFYWYWYQKWDQIDLRFASFVDLHLVFASFGRYVGGRKC